MQGICLTPLTVWCSVAMMPLREMRMSSRCSVSWSRSRRRSRVWKNQDPSSVVLQALCPVIIHSGLSFVTLFGCLRRFQDCFQVFHQIVTASPTSNMYCPWVLWHGGQPGASARLMTPLTIDTQLEKGIALTYKMAAIANHLPV